MAKPVKSTIKRVPTSQSTVRSGKFDAQRTKAISKKVVIPTARPEDRGTENTYLLVLVAYLGCVPLGTSESGFLNPKIHQESNESILRTDSITVSE